MHATTGARGLAVGRRRTRAGLAPFPALRRRPRRETTGDRAPPLERPDRRRFIVLSPEAGAVIFVGHPVVEHRDGAVVDGPPRML